MNHIDANQRIIEILIRLVTGSPADKATAREMAARLDEASLRRLKVAADETAVLAENVLFQKRPELRTRGVDSRSRRRATSPHSSQEFMQNEEQTQSASIKAARILLPAKLAYRPAEAAEATGQSEAYIRRLIRKGIIKAKKSGHNTPITTSALLEWLDSLPDWESPGEPVAKRS
jgi:excisionase family DNA binding protein